MIAWINSHQRSAAICGVTLLVPLIIYLNMLLGAWGLRSEYAKSVDRLGPRIARMQGLLLVEEQLAQSSANAQQQNSRLVYPATAERTSVAASMQSDVRQLMTEAGLSVSNSQVLPVREQEKFDYIGVKLTVAGDVESLDRALAELADFTPLIIVEEVDIWPTRQRTRGSEKATQNATASVRLLSLRSLI